MNDKSPDGLQQKMSDEHRTLRKQIADLRQFWNEVYQLGLGPKYEEMRDRIRRFRDVLAHHFTSEEQSGFLSPKANDTRCRGDLADELKSQHAQFLNTLDQFIQRLAKCGLAYHCWNEVRVDFEDFIQRLDEHETREMTMNDQAVESSHKSTG